MMAKLSYIYKKKSKCFGDTLDKSTTKLPAKPSAETTKGFNLSSFLLSVPVKCIQIEISVLILAKKKKKRNHKELLIMQLYVSVYKAK